MPTKFKPSEQVVNRVRGQKMNTASVKKVWKHYYLKQTTKVELFKTINEARTTPKKRIKCINELVRRCIKIDFYSQAEWDIKNSKELV